MPYHRQKVVGVSAEHFHEQIEAARGQYDVRDSVDCPDCLAQRFDIALRSETNHCLHGEADSKWISDSNNLKGLRLKQPIDSQPDSRWREVDLPGNLSEAGAPVELENRDDLQILLVKFDVQWIHLLMRLSKSRRAVSERWSERLSHIGG